MPKHVGDAICTCGRVAHIKRQANGNKVPYRHCKACNVCRPTTEAEREAMLNNMSEIGSLGEFGKMPQQTSNKPSETGGLSEKKTFESNVTSTPNEWTPPEGLEPEKLEPEQASTPDKQKAKSKNWGFVLKAGVAIVACAAFGAGAYKLSAKSQ